MGNFTPLGDLALALNAEVRANVSRAGLSQSRFAQRIGMTPKVLNDIWKDRRAVSVDEIALICDALGMLPSELVADAERALSRKQRGAQVVARLGMEVLPRSVVDDPESPEAAPAV